MMTSLLNNRYQILGTLGQGGFGETFLAIDTHMPSARKCVIKCLQPMLRSPDAPEWLKDRFQREAAILEELGENNRQIPKLYAYFSENNQFYLVQEWIEGQTLTQLQERQGNLSESDVRNILISLLPVLDFIHSYRLIHRDIKPDNIIIRTSDRLPFLIDFGVIKEAMATIINPNGKTAYSIALGTPGYMASEQAAGRPVYSSDLYSLGLTAIFLLTGKSPQYLESDSQTGEIQWRVHAPQIHSSLATVIDRAIRFHPRDRFPSAKAMLGALTSSSALSGAQTIMVAPPPPQRPPQPIAPAPKASPRMETPAPDSPVLAPESDMNWKQWIGLTLLAFGLTTAAFVGGFIWISSRNRPQPTPSPVFQETQPQPLPQESIAPPSPLPSDSPRPRPRRRPALQVTPTPTPTLSPSPEAPLNPESTPPVTETPIPSPVPSASPVPPASPAPTIIPIPVPPPASESIPPVEVPPSGGNNAQPNSQPNAQPNAQPNTQPNPETQPEGTNPSTPNSNAIAPPQPKRPVPGN